MQDHHRVVELVMHPVSPYEAGESSAFADAAKRVLEAVPPFSEVRLVSPYISHAVIASLIGNRPFRLITDLVACLKGSTDDQLVSLLSKSFKQVRQVDLVHAKVVLTDAAALFGSANLTDSGFAERDELGCLILDGTLVQLLTAWFEELWTAASPATQSDIASAADRGRRAATAGAKPGDSDPASKLTRSCRQARSLGWMIPHLPRARVLPSSSQPSDVDFVHSSDWEELVVQVRRLTQSRDQAEQVLDLMAHALDVSGLDVDDQRLHLNFGGRPMSITINQRYVAWCDKKKRQPEFGFILSDHDVADSALRQIPGAYVTAGCKLSQ